MATIFLCLKTCVRTGKFNSLFDAYILLDILLTEKNMKHHISIMYKIFLYSILLRFRKSLLLGLYLSWKCLSGFVNISPLFSLCALNDGMSWNIYRHIVVSPKRLRCLATYFARFLAIWWQFWQSWWQNISSKN